MKVFVASAVATIMLILGASGPITAGTLPNISGVWYANGSPAARCSIGQNGSSVTLRNQEGRGANGSFSSPSTLETDWGFGGHIRGTISSDLRRIDWSNGSFWTRGSGNSTHSYSYSYSSSTSSSTTQMYMGSSRSSVASQSAPEATPAPERLRIQSYISEALGHVPVHISSLSLRNASEGRYYRQCLWFRNVSTKEATSIDFSFIVQSHSGVVQADFGVVDDGKFTPPVNIDEHCWRGHLWSDRVVSLMEREYVSVKRVTFADGTSWEAGTPFLRGFEDNGARLAEPLEQQPYKPKATPEP